MEKIIFSSTVAISLAQFSKAPMRKMSESHEVIAISSPDEYSQEIEAMPEVRYIPIPMARRISPISDLRSLLSLARVMRRERPRMIHSITPKAGLLCMIAGWLTRVPVRIHTFTGLVFPTSTGWKRRLLMLTDGITCRCATHVVCEGQGVKHDLASHGITRKPLRVLGHGNLRGVDMKRFSHRPEVEDGAKTLRRDDVFTFLYMGRIVRDKGIEELCSAFAKLYEETSAIRLLLVGFTEYDLDPVNEATRHMISTHPGIETAPWQWGDPLVSCYVAGDCYVLPSYREGFPNTVLEAGAMGLPSIVTDVNGSREIIIEGENGTIVPPRDAEALYHAMKRMVSEEPTRMHMSRNARRLVEERFEQSYVLGNLMQFYSEVLA